MDMENVIGLLRLIVIICTATLGMALCVELWNRDQREAAVLLMIMAIRDSVILILLASSIFYSEINRGRDPYIRLMASLFVMIFQIGVLLYMRKKK